MTLEVNKNMESINHLLGKVWNTDCLEFMRQLPDKCVDLVLTDPPYDEYTHRGGRFQADNTFGKVGFKPLANYDFIKDLLRATNTWVIIFCPVESLGKIQSSYNSNYIRGGIWDRVNPSPQMSGDRPAQAVEGIAILHANDIKKKWNGHGRAGIWRESVEFGKKEHETQKPLNLIIKLLNDFSNTQNIIFDPFLGSGTTAVACERLGRKWFGCELEPKYCKIAEERIKVEQSQGKLF